MRPLAALLVLLTLSATAQTRKPAHKPASPEQLKFVLIVSRHGIRPPLHPTSDINQYATDPWPEWEVGLGELTPHGALALTQMGQYLRLRYVEDGLLPPGGCPAPGELYLYADTDHRNIDSTRATFAGFAPNCDHLDINMMAPRPDDKRDPLFNTVPYSIAPPPAPASEAAMRAALHTSPEISLTARGNPELNELAHILAPDPAHQPAKPILKQPIEFKPGTWGVAAHGPLPTSSSLVEDLKLEFVDDKPLNQIGWGRLGQTDAEVAATLSRLLPLNIKFMGLSLRTPLYARAQGSSLLAHLLATLHQAATSNSSKPSEPWALAPETKPVVPATAHFVYLSAHDSNLSNLGGLLGLHWRAEGHFDDTPPDSQLAFELWQRPGTTGASENDFDIRIVYRAQTLMQLRTAETLSLDHPPAEVELTPTGCVAHRPCPLATFLRAATRTLDPAFVYPNIVPLTLAP